MKTSGSFKPSHGHARRGEKSPAYLSWVRMRRRCNNPNHSTWKHYGGRGIVVCERWGNFKNFLADMGHPPPGMSIERKDNSLGYEPINCRWATQKEQTRNKRNTLVVTHNGRSMALAAWAEETGIPRTTLWNRLRVGWPMDRVLSQDRYPGEARCQQR